VHRRVRPDHKPNPNLNSDEATEEPGEARNCEAGQSVIGPTLVMKGTLTFSGDLIIDGQFDGTVTDEGGSLSIGTCGNVNANVNCGSVEIAGGFEGDTEGTGTITLRRTARLHGELTAKTVNVEGGTNLEDAIISGQIRVLKKP
jgi:cytoskeletal protein CcmA (bactofilin family)